MLNQEPRAQPTLNLVIYHDPEAGRVVTNRLEFGLEAAQQSWEAQQGYWRQRRIQLVARDVLSAQDFGGRMTAVAQWEAMIRAILEGRLPQFGLPSQPGASNDLFLAFEYAVDEFNNLARIVRVYRESEIDKRIVWDDQGRATQILVLQQGGTTAPRRAFGGSTRQHARHIVWRRAGLRCRTHGR